MDQTPSTNFFGGTQLHDAITLTPSPLSAHYSDQLAGYFFILRLQNRVQALTAPPGSGRAGQQQWQVWSDLQSADGHPFSRSPVHNSPPLEGSFTWDGPTLWFTPLQQLDPNQVYQVAISAGAQSIHGHKLWKSSTWQASVREPALLYLVLDTDEGGLYRFDFSTGESVTSKQMKSFLGRSVRMEY